MRFIVEISKKPFVPRVSCDILELFGDPISLKSIIPPSVKFAILQSFAVTKIFSPQNGGSYHFRHQTAIPKIAETCRNFNSNLLPFNSTSKLSWCRSTSAKPAVRRSPQQRTFQFHQQRTRTFRTLKLIYETIKLVTSFTYTFNASFIHQFYI